MTSGDKRRLKIGILGVAAAAHWYYLPATKAWSDRLELKTVCDLDGDGARRFGALYEADAVFTDYERCWLTLTSTPRQPSFLTNAMPSRFSWP